MLRHVRILLKKRPLVVIFSDLKIYLDNLYYLKNIELLQELDSLLLQRAERLHKIGELHDQLSTILITAQKNHCLMLH